MPVPSGDDLEVGAQPSRTSATQYDIWSTSTPLPRPRPLTTHLATTCRSPTGSIVATSKSNASHASFQSRSHSMNPSWPRNGPAFMKSRRR